MRDFRRFAGTESAFRAWVFTIARNRLIDDGRRRGRRPVDMVPDGSFGTSEADSVEVEVIDAAATDEVKRIVGRLPPDQRDALILRVLGDLIVQEVSHVVGKSPGAVKALQRRGLATIKDAIQKRGVPLSPFPHFSSSLSSPILRRARPLVVRAFRVR